MRTAVASAEPPRRSCPVPGCCNPALVEHRYAGDTAGVTWCAVWHTCRYHSVKPWERLRGTGRFVHVIPHP